jgi:hypothetical protein
MMSRRLWWAGLILVVLVSSRVLVGYAFTWEELKGEHFIIFYTDDKPFGYSVLRKAEEYYRLIAKDLGYQRYSDFWQWDDRVKIYIYPDRESYHQAVNQPGWSEGVADYKNKEILSYAWSQNFLDSLLPHEMAHLIFRDYVGFRGKVPLWMDEGVAQWSELPKRTLFREQPKSFLQEKDLVPIEELMTADVRSSQDVKAVQHFYIQSAMLVGFMIEKYGASNFINFCRKLRDGKTIEGALKFVYPTSIRTISDLDTQFRKHMEAAL